MSSKKRRSDDIKSYNDDEVIDYVKDNPILYASIQASIYIDNYDYSNIRKNILNTDNPYVAIYYIINILGRIQKQFFGKLGAEPELGVFPVDYKYFISNRELITFSPIGIWIEDFENIKGLGIYKESIEDFLYQMKNNIPILGGKTEFRFHGINILWFVYQKYSQDFSKFVKEEVDKQNEKEELDIENMNI